VSPGGDSFRTSVSGAGGVWPGLPEIWSYSSLREAEECPRRWSLSRATYPRIWDHSGYPPRPNLPSLLGEVVHRVLELILRDLHFHSCETLDDPCAVEVLKQLGGYSKLIERVIDERLERLVDNPRIAGRIDSLRTALRTRVPDIRRRVQAFVTRTTVKAVSVFEASNEDAPRRRPLGLGSHTEVELRAPELGFTGRADLLTIADGSCSITDYKTGIPNEHHPEQLRTYALLWSRDVDLNPNKVPVGQLVISYTTQDEVVRPPTESELDEIATQLAARVVAAESQLRLRPPPARPSPSMCRLCSVRHLCDDYWAAVANAPPLQSQPLEFEDFEVVVGNQNGPRSWMVELKPDQAPALLRTPTETPGFTVGDPLRLLDVGYAREDDSGQMIVTVTQASETFLLEDQS
jgi:CRISPR/Cas system-associated exonuclease Cas4 (RecB family)